MAMLFNNEQPEPLARVTERVEGNIAELKMLFDKHSPSWQNYGYGEGSAELKAQVALNAGWLQLYCEERGELSVRSTFISMAKVDALALRDFLNSVYPEVR